MRSHVGSVCSECNNFFFLQNPHMDCMFSAQISPRTLKTFWTSLRSLIKLFLTFIIYVLLFISGQFSLTGAYKVFLFNFREPLI